MPGAAVERQLRVLDVDMIDAIGEAPQELHRVDPLPVQVARVEGEAELLAVVEGVEHQFRRVEIERELAGVNLAGEPHAALAGGVEDRVPLLGELLHGVGDDLLLRGAGSRRRSPRSASR